MKKDKPRKKPGPKPKYTTEEEKREARRLSSKKYYETHKEICTQKQSVINKKRYEIVKQFRELNKNDCDNVKLKE